jgi:Ca-activated chloride channel family protein
MKINKLTIIFCLYFMLTFSAAQSEDTTQTIAVDHSIDPNRINISGSGMSSSYSTVTLTVIGSKEVPPRRNINVVLFIDNSNSMFGTKLKTAKNAAISFIDEMDDSKDKIGLVSFNGTLGPGISPIDDFEKVIGKIKAINSSNNSKEGITCLSIGLNEAIKNLSSVEANSEKVIIFLSDGNNTTCKNDTPCRDAVRAKNNGIIIYTIGLDDTGNGTKYLKCMAETTGGRYYSATVKELIDIYSQ